MNLYEQYKQMMETGRMPERGLEELLLDTGYYQTLKKIMPSNEEVYKLFMLSKSSTYWDSDLDFNDPDRFYTFTPLRQTIVLLICAMHGEI